MMENQKVKKRLTSGCLSSSSDSSSRRKGDFVLQTGHVIEIVTKLFLVVQVSILLNFFCPQFTDFRNKPECLLLASFSSLV